MTCRRPPGTSPGHIALRDRLDLLTRPVEEERAGHEAERTQWIDYLRSHGLLGATDDEQQVVEALHRFVARTPARLIAVGCLTRLGIGGSSTSPVPIRSTPTGGSRWPTKPAIPWCSTTCRAPIASAGWRAHSTAETDD